MPKNIHTLTVTRRNGEVITKKHSSLALAQQDARTMHDDDQERLTLAGRDAEIEFDEQSFNGMTITDEQGNTWEATDANYFGIDWKHTPAKASTPGRTRYVPSSVRTAGRYARWARRYKQRVHGVREHVEIKLAAEIIAGIKASHMAIADIRAQDSRDAAATRRATMHT